jgi:hypothetical protein
MANIKRANASSITKAGVAIADVPDAPTIGAVADLVTGTSVSVAYTAAVTGGAVTTFTATSTPGSLTGTGASPITVTGLTSGTAYTFKVKGTNSTATGPESAASASVTPVFPPLSAYDSIATTTVSTPVSSVSFSSIPSTYKHLQLRFLAGSATTNQDVFATFNGDSTSANYSLHYLYGGGSGAAAGGSTINAGHISAGFVDTSGTGFGVGIVDILDYADTNKYKTTRTLTGYDANGSGACILYSGLWKSTSAITSITLVINNSRNFIQYSSFALYGIKGD